MKGHTLCVIRVAVEMGRNLTLFVKLLKCEENINIVICVR